MTPPSTNDCAGRGFTSSGSSAPKVSLVTAVVKQNAFMWFTNLHSDGILTAFLQLTGSRPGIVNNRQATGDLAITAVSHG